MNYSDSKITDLVKAIGEVTSENFSPTLRAKLVHIDEYHGTCLMEVVPSPYKLSAENNHRAGERYHAPIYRIHNAFFF
jgi:hypothetical protein